MKQLNNITKNLSHYKAKNFVVAFFTSGGRNEKEKQENGKADSQP